MKSEVIKHWFGIDTILFGQPATSALSEDVLPQYLSTKGALLSNLFEIYKKINLNSDKKFKTVSEMVKESQELADSSKKRAKEILINESITKLVKEEIKDIGSVEGLDESQVARYVVLRRRNAVAIDSMLLELSLDEDQKKSLTDWQGKILVDAHKTLRDSLIDISLQ